MTGTANTAGAIALAAATLPALGFAVAPVFEHTADTWQEGGPPVSIHRNRLPSRGDHDRAGRRRGRTVDRIHPQAQPGRRRAGQGPLRPRDRSLLPLRARRLPGPLRRCCPELRLPVSRRGLRLSRRPDRGAPRRVPWIASTRSFARDRSWSDRATASTTSSDGSHRATPGQPLDGIGQLLYPARPSTPPAPPGAKS